MVKHENGIFTVDCGSIINKQNGMGITNPSVVIDTDTGTVLKIGDAVWVKDYYNKLCNVALDINCTFLTFDRYRGALDVDGICTIMNYMMNSLGQERTCQLIQMPVVDLLKEITRLQLIGW